MKKYFLAFLISNIFIGYAAVYQDIQKPGDFVKEIFSNKTPVAKKVWIKGDVKKNIEQILQHSFSSLRVRYWKHEDMTVWILDEIGKEEAITFGIAIKDNYVHNAKVLTYRETRGFEIIRKDFQNQFKNAKLKGKIQLNKDIDGISGATLSVKAMTKVVLIALYLHHITANK